MRILFVLHAFPPDDLGGTELHAFDLARSLKERGHAVYVFCRLWDEKRKDYEIIDSKVEGIDVRRIVNNLTHVPPDGRWDINPRIREAFRTFLQETGPDIVHLHHLIALSTDIPEVIESFGLPYALTVHDYWLACDRIQLLRPDGSRCDGPREGEACARYCRRGIDRKSAIGRLGGAVLRRMGLRRSRHPVLAGIGSFFTPGSDGRVPPAEKRFWRSRTRDILGLLSRPGRVVVPSEHLKKRLREWGAPEETLRVIPHGIASPAEILPLPDDPVIAYLGGLGRHKGVHVLLKAMRFVPERAELRIWGTGPDEAYLSELREIARPFKERVFFGGRYEPRDLDRIIGRARVVVVPSIWEETFCIVAREAQARGRPAVVSDLGGLSEAVEEGRTGCLVPPGDPEALGKTLTNLLSPGGSEDFKWELPVSFRTPADHAGEIEALYLELTS